MTKADRTRRIKVQRTRDGLFLGACIAIGADDLPFVSPETEWLSVEKRTAENSLIMKLRVVTTP